MHSSKKSRLITIKNVFLAFIFIAATSTLLIAGGNLISLPNFRAPVVNLPLGAIGGATKLTSDFKMSPQIDNVPKVKSEAVKKSASTCSVEVNYIADRTVDSNGQLCKTNDIDKKTHCCPEASSVVLSKLDYTPVKEGAASAQYSCGGCNSDDGCCKDYDICISCCMHPLNAHYMDKLRTSTKNFVYTQLLLPDSDPFQYCRYKCRRSSGSVQYENSYRSEHTHCYDLKYTVVSMESVNSDRVKAGSDGRDRAAIEILTRNVLHD